MRRDSSGIDTADLASRIGAAYGLDLAALTFIPKGEDGYNYAAEGRTGTRWFVKAQNLDRSPHFAQGLAAAWALRHDGRLAGVVAPLRTRDGALSIAWGRYGVAVFPFIEGRSGWETPLTPAGRAEAADLLAAIHGQRTVPVTESLPRERFENPFAPRLVRVLRVAATPDPAAVAYRRRVRELVLARQDEIRAALDTMAAMRGALERLTGDEMLTHGDPNLANLVVDAAGRVHMVDWNDAALGPRERDLSAFREEEWFGDFLAHYRARAGPVSLRAEVFTFYVWRWVVQELADYTTRILFHNTDPADDEHAWQELQPYLPVPHDGIRRQIELMGATLRKLDAR